MIDQLRVTSVLPAPLSCQQHFSFACCSSPVHLCCLFCILNSLNFWLWLCFLCCTCLEQVQTQGRQQGCVPAFSQPGIRHRLCLFSPDKVFKCVYIHFQDHIVTFCIVEPPCGRWPCPEFVFGNTRVLKANISIYSKYFLLLPAVLAGEIDGLCCLIRFGRACSPPG